MMSSESLLSKLLQPERLLSNSRHSPLWCTPSNCSSHEVNRELRVNYCFRLISLPFTIQRGLHSRSIYRSVHFSMNRHISHSAISYANKYIYESLFTELANGFINVLKLYNLHAHYNIRTFTAYNRVQRKKITINIKVWSVLRAKIKNFRILKKLVCRSITTYIYVKHIKIIGKKLEVNE